LRLILLPAFGAAADRCRSLPLRGVTGRPDCRTAPHPRPSWCSGRLRIHRTRGELDELRRLAQQIIGRALTDPSADTRLHCLVHAGMRREEPRPLTQLGHGDLQQHPTTGRLRAPPMRPATRHQHGGGRPQSRGVGTREPLGGLGRPLGVHQHPPRLRQQRTRHRSNRGAGGRMPSHGASHAALLTPPWGVYREANARRRFPARRRAAPRTTIFRTHVRTRSTVAHMFESRQPSWDAKVSVMAEPRLDFFPRAREEADVTAMPSGTIRYVELTPAEFRQRLPESLNLYVQAMRYPAGTAEQRAPMWLAHMLRDGWRNVTALDA